MVTSPLLPTKEENEAIPVDIFLISYRRENPYKVDSVFFFSTYFYFFFSHIKCEVCSTIMYSLERTNKIFWN